jgi:hypothetical protein
MRENRNSGFDKLKRRIGSVYTGMIPVTVLILFIAMMLSCTKTEINPPTEADIMAAAGIGEIIPANLADSVVVNPVIIVTFREGTEKIVVTNTSIELKKGTSLIQGTTTYSGLTASFMTDTDLAPESEYTATVKTLQKGSSDADERKEYSWNFKTGRRHRDVGLSIVSVSPLNSATSVPVGTTLTVTFNQDLNSSMKNSTKVLLYAGTKSVSGAVTFSGKTATFKPNINLTAKTGYTGKVLTGVYNDDDGDDDKSGKTFSWSFTTASANDITAPTVVSVVPVNSATAVSTSSKAMVTFSEAMSAATITATSFTVKQGSTAVAGTVTYTGTVATFTPTAALAANTVYTGTVTTGVKDVAGNALAANYIWSFTTASVNDVTAPTVASVVPVNNATAVSTNSKATVTFNEAMSAATITTTSFTVKQGSSAVAGTVTYTGTVATFTPTAALAANTVYTGTVTTAAKDVAGNALGANYTWSFTTSAVADVTAPTVLSVTPVINATSVAVNSKATVTFSEAMNSATITPTTFTLKQGSTSVAGTISYSGTTATFTPSAALAGNTVYTGTITTGAKDAAGNAMASNYTWSFTTIAAAPAGKSFSADVMPILNICNTCHTHNWTPSSNASTFYTNLVNSGHVNSTTPTSSKIYTKINGGHPGGSTISATQKTTVLTWFTEGAKNN